MANELMKRRGFYALETAREAAILSFKQFFPLFGAWAVSLAIPVAIIMGGTLAGGIIDHMSGHKQAAGATLLVLLVGIAMIGGLYGGFIAITLKVARGLPCRMADMWRPLNQTLSCLAVLVIVTTGVGLGMLLVIPGALLYLKWQLAPYYVIDRNYGPIQALKQSWADTDRMFAPMAIMDLGFFAIHWLSGFTGIGPILSNMVLQVASALVYTRWLTDENNPEFLKSREAIEQHDARDFRISPARDNID